MASMPPPSGSKLSFNLLNKNILVWVLILFTLLALWQVRKAQLDEREDISYTRFAAELDQSNISDVEVIGGPLKDIIEGEFKREVAVVRRRTQETRLVTKFSVTLPIKDSEELLANLIDKGVTVTGREPKESFGLIMVRLLPWILIIGLWVFFFRQVQQGGNRAFQFGRSKAKLLTPDMPKVTFGDVAGADEAKVELEEIIEFLKDPEKFQRLGGRLPKGALLIGPPGTGKTLLAKAVAGEAGRPFFSMSGSDFVEMFVGVGASRVRDLFEQGKAHAPCLIFIDEIDAVGRHRGAGLGGGHDEREQTLNQLLVEMDGFESNEGVILLAATNRPDVLDPALLRPGRFDRQIMVDMPDIRGREMILKVHARKIPLDDDVKLEIIARGTPGLAGADLANLVNEGALLAARRNQQVVTMRDLEDAKDKVMLGIERKSMQQSDEELKLTAYHEAGHAIVNLSMPGLDPVHKVTIVPRGRSLGLTFSLPESDRRNFTKEYMHGKLAMMFGGRTAEEIIFGPEKVTTGAAQDIAQATTMARRMVSEFGMSDAVGPVAVGENQQQVFLGREFAQNKTTSERTAELVDTEIKRILEEAYDRAEETLKEKIDMLHAMAAALLERETLDRRDVELLGAGKPLPPIKTPPPIAPDVPPSDPATSADKDVRGTGPVLGAPGAEPAGA